MDDVYLRPALEQDRDNIMRLLEACEPACAAHLGIWRSAIAQTEVDPSHIRCWSAIASGAESLVASGAVRHERLDKYRLDIVVHGAWRCKGIGTQLLTRLESGLRGLRAGTVHTRIHATATEALRFFEHRGFRSTQHMVELRLAVQAFDPAPWNPLLEHLQERGLTFHTLHDELRDNPRMWVELQELQNAVLPDWPDFDPGPVQLLQGDAFRRQLESFNVMPEGFFIAKHRSIYVGYSGLAELSITTPDMVGNSGTAVLHAYRGQHIATALKVRCLSYAKARGYEVVTTGSANPAMLHVNENLGFKRHSVEVRLVKAFVPDT